jgi:GTPase KRas protein
VNGGTGVSNTHTSTLQITLNHFVETYDPTIEDSYRKQVMIDGESCMLEVLDTAGQEEYTALRDQWIRDGEAFLLVYSISSRGSFNRIRRFHAQVGRVKESSASSPAYPGSPLSSIAAPLQRVPILMVGNKSDRVTEREVSTQEGHALAREFGCEFMESSAKNCINIEKPFYDLVRQLQRQRMQPLPTGKPWASQKAVARTGYIVERRWWGARVSIPPNESKSEDGQKRLTRALVTTAKSNHERELVAYLDAGANPNGHWGSDGAAIHAAAASGHANIVNFLLKRKSAINAKGPSGTSPIQIAAAEGHLAVVRLLLHKGAQIDQTSQLHGTALSAAASRGRVEIVRFLLKKEAKVNVVGGPYGNALQAAAWVGSAPIVEALLGAGADINARGDGDCTALQIAAFAGHANVIRTLLDLGGAFNIDAPGGKYGCALRAADDQGHFEAVTLLLKAGATPTLRSPSEIAISDSPENDEAEDAAMTAQIANDAVSPPIPTGDWPLSASTPVLTTALSTDHLSRSLDRPLRGLGERPNIHAIGFSSISSPVDAVVEYDVPFQRLRFVCRY